MKRAAKLSLVSFLGYCAYYQQAKFKAVQLVYSDTPFNNQLASKFKNLSYSPSFFMPGCLSQMIFSFLPRRAQYPQFSYKRQTVKARDGEILSIDWADKNEDSDRLLIIFPGLAGGSNDEYVKLTVGTFLDKTDFSVCVPHVRGVNNSPLTLPKIYHAGFTDDMEDALQQIKASTKCSEVFCIGFSMGANQFVQLTAKTDKFDSFFKGFVSVSNPLNMSEIERLNRGSVIDWALRTSMIAYLKTHEAVLSLDKS